MSGLFEEEFEEYDPYDTEQSGVMEDQNSFFPPKESSFYISNQNTEELFLDLTSKEKIPHAVIFSGIKGIGKATFAYRLARFLLKHGKSSPGDSLFGDAAPAILPETMDMDREDSIFRRIISGGHADFLSLEPAEGKTGLDIAQIRKVAPFLRKTASEEGGWRIVLIDDANTMNRNAQNALLKILEEPPSQTILILISHNNAALLPTTLSRSRVFHFDAPDQQTFEQLLKRKDPNLKQGDIEFLREYSSSSIGDSFNFIDYGGLDLFTHIMSHLSSFPNADMEAIHLFSEQFSKSSKEEVWSNFSNLMVWVFQSLALSKARNIPIPPSLQTLEPLQTLWSLEEQVEICKMLESFLRRASYANLDKRQASLDIFNILYQSINK